MTKLALCAGCVAGIALFSSSEANAQDWEPQHGQAKAGAEIYVYSGEFFGTSIPLIGFLHVDVHEHVFLDFQFPFTSTIDGPGDDAYAALGNPTVGAHYIGDITDELWLHAGGTLGFPLGAIDDNDWRLPLALAMRGLVFHDHHLYSIESVPIWANVGVEYQPIDPIFIRGSVEPIVDIPVSRGPRTAYGAGFGDNDADFTIQNTFEFEARADFGLGGGVAILPVWAATGNFDNAQVSSEGFLSFDNNHFLMRIGGRLALDEPLGFGFDDGGVATLHMVFGGHLD